MSWCRYGWNTPRYRIEEEGNYKEALIRRCRRLLHPYGPDFEFYDSTDLAVSAEMIESICLQEIAKYGVDNVVLLPPYRQKTETGVNALNQRIQGKVNPPDPARNEAVYLGYMSGSFQGFVTDGVAMYNSQKSCYVIATSVGVRLQAGDLELYLTTEDDFVKVNGDLRVDGNVIYSGELMKSS